MRQPVPGIQLVPVVHERVELAAVVRRTLEDLSPAAVAVELPVTLEEAVERAVARLPQISVVISVVISEEEDEDALVWVAAPGDPLVEALRWARQRNLPRFLIDPDVPYAEQHEDAVPDPHALLELGAQEYLRLLTEALADAPASPTDRQREAGMAHHLLAARRRLDDEGRTGPLLALVGAAHLHRLAEALTGPTAEPFARPRRSRVLLRHLHPESLTGLMRDPPVAHGVWELEAWESPESGERPPEPPLAATRARRLSLVRGDFTVVSREEDRWGSARQRRVVERALHRALCRTEGESVGTPDRRALARLVWEVGAVSWEEQTRETVNPWQRRIFFDYARRQARLGGQLAAGLWEWVVAARGVADDNLAWEVFEAARAYPWQGATAEIETARLDGAELDLGQRRITFRRRFFRVKQRPRLMPVDRRPTPADPTEWLRGFDGGGLCSYPPEDLVIEDWGRYLQSKAEGLLAAERRRVEPFSVSLLDGIDLQETLRRVEDDRVWVVEHGRSPGKAGSVVAIFDRDLEGGAYPYLMTWNGEHDEESDMAFYSTHPGDQVVGPGIMRATYGGLLLTYPRGRLWEVWRDRDYRSAREKAEVLLMAGIDYSVETLVAHVAAQPPAERMHRYAARQGKRIVHVPLGSLSPTTVRKVRVVHILVGHDKRAVAGRYVW